MTLVNGSRPSGYSVRCFGETTRFGKDSCGVLNLTQDEYRKQLSNANLLWVCPNCGGPGWIMEPEENEDDSHE